MWLIELRLSTIRNLPEESLVEDAAIVLLHGVIRVHL